MMVTQVSLWYDTHQQRAFAMHQHTHGWCVGQQQHHAAGHHTPPKHAPGCFGSESDCARVMCSLQVRINKPCWVSLKGH